MVKNHLDFLVSFCGLSTAMETLFILNGISAVVMHKNWVTHKAFYPMHNQQLSLHSRTHIHQSHDTQLFSIVSLLFRLSSLPVASNRQVIRKYSSFTPASNDIPQKCGMSLSDTDNKSSL